MNAQQSETNNHDMSVATVLRRNAPELHKDRRMYRHAQETPIVLGVQPGISDIRLYGFKRGLDRNPPVPLTLAQPCFKEEALAAYIAETGNPVEPLILKRGKYIAVMDGVSKDHQLVVDIQFLGMDDASIMAHKGLMPEHYMARLQHMMAVADAPEAHLWIFDDESKSGTLVKVARDVGYLARIFAAWYVFEERVDRGDVGGFIKE